jgi:hypothetical protein
MRKRPSQKMKIYKYRTLAHTGGAPNTVENDRGLRALFEQTAWCSSRTQFNDPFDCHMLFEWPNIADTLKMIRRFQPPYRRAYTQYWVKNGRLTNAFFDYRQNMENGIKQMVDTYPIYCWCGSGDNQLLWSHYAASYTGYCVEFDASKLQVGEDPTGFGPVNYVPSLPSFPCSEFLHPDREIVNEEYARQFMRILRTKLDIWDYELEHRTILSGRIPEGQKGISIPFPSGAITAVIFGPAMDPVARKYIVSTLPYKTQFKELKIDLKRAKLDICNIGAS